MNDQEQSLEKSSSANSNINVEAPEQLHSRDAVASDKQEPYSIFNKSEKRVIVAIASLAALFSPLSANIYYPAVPTLSRDLGVSVNLINLTITVYLIFQGLAPSIVGSLSDSVFGRKGGYILCFVLYIAADIGLALQNNYAALMVLRCLQSSGSSGTVALANAVVSDIVTSAERGGYISLVSMGAMVGPAFGPTIGGLLSQYLGVSSIFWFLAIAAGVTLIIILVALPETCRKLVGNGSEPTSTWQMSLPSYIRLRARRKRGEPSRSSTAHFKARPKPLAAFLLFTRIEPFCILLFSGIPFAAFYMIVASMPPQLESKYGLSTLHVGFCYFATGFGSMAASLTGGRFLNWNFRRHAKKCGLPIEANVQQNLDNFPIERARLEISFPALGIALISAICYGWTMQAHTSLAAPLIFLFFATFGLSSAFQGLSTLIVDLNRDSPGTATAAMNLARCWLGAGGTALVNPLLEAVDIGWTTVIIAGVPLLFTPLLVIIIRNGPKWRERERNRRKESQT